MKTISKQIDQETNISYDYDENIRNKIADKIMEFFFKYQTFNGESIVQSDEIQINAPELLADIADDIIKFEISYKNEN